MEDVEQVDPTAGKALKLAQLGLLLSVLGIGVLGFLYFQGQAALSEMSGDNLKQMIKGEVAGSMKDLQSQLQTVTEKNLELEVKIIELKGLVDRISALEMKMSQFEVDLQKNASLRGRIAELEAASKRSKGTAKPAAKSAPTKKSKEKAPQKAKKKKK